jgi:hypothetical protein
MSSATSAVSEEQVLAMQAKEAANELKFESKADVLQNGLVHPDWKMRKAAAIELPRHCERRPVETFVVREYVKLLGDPVMEVRKTTLEHLTDLVEKGDRIAIRGILSCMWGDRSWAVRLASIHAIEQVAHVGDEQALMGLIARITDLEAARGGQFWVRVAAREAALRMSGSEKGLIMVMDRLKHESWEAQQQSIQCMLLGAKKIPCRIDDDEDRRGPLKQGYHSPPRPKHMAQDRTSHSSDESDGFKPYDEAESRRLTNGYEASTHQSEIIPRKLISVWEQPDNFGKPMHERTHEWRRNYRFTLEATGFDEAHFTELSGRHYKETARSLYWQLKNAGGGNPPLLASKRQDPVRTVHSLTSRPMTSDSGEQDSADEVDENQPTVNARDGAITGAMGAKDARLSGSEAWNSTTGGQQLSEAEAKRAAEYQHLIRARQAKLRSLRRRKSLASHSSFFHSSLLQNESLRLCTANAVNTRDSILLSGVGERTIDEREFGSSSSGNANPAEDMSDPVRAILPMITQSSFSFRNKR